MASNWIYYQSDGSNNSAAQNTHAQAKAMSAPGSIFVYGGDIYNNGTDEDFGGFDMIYRDVLPLLAETAGNHDWNTPGAAGYDNYWLARQPPVSLTKIDTTITDKDDPSRHHYTQPLGNDWLGIFIDCGPGASKPLTGAALGQINDWITAHGSRSIIVFLHHARLSRGLHDNNIDMDCLWQTCFDADGAPRVAAWVAGHNHNMGVYSPRAKGSGPGADPPCSSAGVANGVAIFINGAGGAVRYSQDDSSAQGTMPDWHDADNYGFLRIELVDAGTAVFQNFSTGPTGFSSASAILPQTTIQV